MSFSRIDRSLDFGRRKTRTTQNPCGSSAIQRRRPIKVRNRRRRDHWFCSRVQESRWNKSLRSSAAKPSIAAFSRDRPAIRPWRKSSSMRQGIWRGRRCSSSANADRARKGHRNCSLGGALLPKQTILPLMEELGRGPGFSLFSSLVRCSTLRTGETTRRFG